MKTFTLFGALALFLLPATAALAVPMCDPPHISNARDAGGNRITTQDDVIAMLENRLRSEGIDVHNSRLWNGCIQTFVTDASGHTKMRFYDPNTYEEVPVN